MHVNSFGRKITIHSTTLGVGNEARRNPKEARTEVKPLPDVSGSSLIAELHRKSQNMSRMAASIPQPLPAGLFSDMGEV